MPLCVKLVVPPNGCITSMPHSTLNFYILPIQITCCETALGQNCAIPQKPPLSSLDLGSVLPRGGVPQK